MKALFIFLIGSFFLSSCQPTSLETATKIFENEQPIKRDTIVFYGSPKNTYSEVFNLDLIDANNDILGAFKEDSVYLVKISSKQDLKFNLLPLTKNLTIRSNILGSFNEFWIETKKLHPDSTYETAKAEIFFDTTYNKPVIIRKDVIKDSITNELRTVSYHLKWKGLGTVEMKIKRK